LKMTHSNAAKVSCAQNEHGTEKGRTSEKLAKQHGVSRETVKRAGQFAAAVEQIEKENQSHARAL
jgi:hypothetical protein